MKEILLLYCYKQKSRIKLPVLNLTTIRWSCFIFAYFHFSLIPLFIPLLPLSSFFCPLRVYKQDLLSAILLIVVNCLPHCSQSYLTVMQIRKYFPLLKTFEGPSIAIMTKINPIYYFTRFSKIWFLISSISNSLLCFHIWLPLIL